MKKFLAILIAASITIVSFAQDNAPQQKKGNGAERIRAEKIAYLTARIDLTVEEAQAFWPLYNKIEAEQKELAKAEREAFKALNIAIREGKPEAEVSKLLDAYVSAKQANVNLHLQNSKAYKKVLSSAKLAKFYTADEMFRRMQINNLRGHKDGKYGQGMHPGQKPSFKPGPGAQRPGFKPGQRPEGGKPQADAGKAAE